MFISLELGSNGVFSFNIIVLFLNSPNYQLLEIQMGDLEYALSVGDEELEMSAQLAIGSLHSGQS